MSAHGQRPGPSGSLVGFLIGTGLSTVANGTFILLVGPVVAARGHTEAVLGSIVAIGGVSSLLLRIPAGNVFRPHRVTVLLLGGSLLAGIGYGFLPVASGASALAGLSALQGAGFAVATTVGMAGLLERRPHGIAAGSLMGWYTGSIGAGYALAGFVGGTFAHAIGLRGTLIAAGLCAVISGCLTVWSLGRLPSHRSDGEGGAPRLRGWVRGMPPGVWLGAAIAVYINVVNGGLNAFLPLYGLGLGFTLMQVGVLSGVHASLASLIRFGAGTLLRRTSYRAVIIVTVVTMAIAVTAVAVPGGFLPLVALVSVIGLSRGVLRVVSGALVMDSAGPSSRHRGRASGIYLGGLDLGTTIGPLVGGTVGEVVGVRGSFPVLGLVPAAIFLVGVATVFRRMRPSDLRGASITPEAP